MTNKDYIENSDIINVGDFDFLWRDNLSFFSEVSLDSKQRDVYKCFAEKIYNEVMDRKKLQKILDESFNDGLLEGKMSVFENITKEVDKIVTKYILDFGSLSRGFKHDIKSLLED